MAGFVGIPTFFRLFSYLENQRDSLSVSDTGHKTGISIWKSVARAFFLKNLQANNNELFRKLVRGKTNYGSIEKAQIHFSGFFQP